MTILSSATGVLDTGVTLVLLDSAAFEAYKTATGGTLDESTGLLEISSEQFQNLQPLNFTIEDSSGTLHSYSFVADAQIWPQALNANIGGKAGAFYLVVGQVPESVASEGISFVLGSVFLERIYTAYYAAGVSGNAAAVGLSQTSSTYTTGINAD